MWKTDGHNFTRKNAIDFRNASAVLDALGHGSNEEVECFVITEDTYDNTLQGLLLQRSENGLYRRIGLFDQAEKAAFEHIEQEEVTII